MHAASDSGREPGHELGDELAAGEWHQGASVRFDDLPALPAAIAVVTVARALTVEQAERLRAALSKQVGREVSLQVTVDPAVIGGVRVQLGDEVIEGTVAGRLDAAERQLN